MTGLIGGALLYWLQVYAFYQPVTFTPGQEISLTPIGSSEPEWIVADNVEGIDGDSSPLKFRACFTTPLSQAMLTETYQVYENPEPTIAPHWFPCFEAKALGAALESGEAIAFLSVANIRPDVDRVVAVLPDGRAYAWHQLRPEKPNGM